jgi:hypothetical protein
MAPIQATLERSRRAQRQFPALDRAHPTAGQPARLRPEPAELLRELAFVYHATRTVREAITGTAR